MMLTITTCNRPQNLMSMKRSPRIQFTMLSNKLFGRVRRQWWGKRVPCNTSALERADMADGECRKKR
jgi:hypothetical protein